MEPASGRGPRGGCTYRETGGEGRHHERGVGSLNPLNFSIVGTGVVELELSQLALVCSLDGLIIGILRESQNLRLGSQYLTLHLSHEN